MSKIIYEYETLKNGVLYKFSLTDDDIIIQHRSNHPFNVEIGDIIEEDYVSALLRDIRRMQERIADLEEVIEEYEKDVI